MLFLIALVMGPLLVLQIIHGMALHARAERGNPHVQLEGKTIDDMIAAYMKEHDVSGLTLAIVQAPYITRVAGYGVVDREVKLLAASNTMFPLPPRFGEAYTAVAVMQLVEGGKLGLDDPIGKHLPQLPEPWKGLPVRALILHSSGLPDFTAPPDYDSNSNTPADKLIASVAGQPLAFPTGTQVRPSATNHLVLQMLVEKLSGGSYQAFVRANQFERLGLKYTYFSTELGKFPREHLKKDEKHSKFLVEAPQINPIEVAVGYRGAGSTLTAVPPLNPDGLALPRGAVIYTSSHDISVWDVGLAGGILIKDPNLRAVIYTPQKLADGKEVPTSGPWAFPGRKGLMIAAGTEYGCSAFLSRYTAAEDLLCVTLQANKEGLDFTELATKIAGSFDARLLVTTAEPPPAPAEEKKPAAAPKGEQPKKK